MTQDQLEAIGTQLEKLCEEAKDLMVELPLISDDPQIVSDVAIFCGATTVRLEEIRRKIIALRGRVKTMTDRANDAEHDAWNEAANHGVSADQAPRERYAVYETSNIQQRIDARRARDALTLCDTALEVIASISTSLREVRNAADAVLRAMSINVRITN